MLTLRRVSFSIPYATLHSPATSSMPQHKLWSSRSLPTSAISASCVPSVQAELLHRPAGGPCPCTCGWSWCCCMALAEAAKRSQRSMSLKNAALSAARGRPGAAWRGAPSPCANSTGSALQRRSSARAPEQQVGKSSAGWQHARQPAAHSSSTRTLGWRASVSSSLPGTLRCTCGHAQSNAFYSFFLRMSGSV